MSQTDQTAEELFDSVTGFDEIAIAQQFGRTVMELAEKDASMFGRAMVFIARRREGDSDSDAWKAAMELTTKQFTEYFAEESNAGKDAETEPSPEASLSSVS